MGRCTPPFKRNESDVVTIKGDLCDIVYVGLYYKLVERPVGFRSVQLGILIGNVYEFINVYL